MVAVLKPQDNMGKPSKKAEANAPEEILDAPIAETTKEEAVEAEDVVAEKSPKEEIPSYVEEAMKSYPQYEKVWITPKGFVHPESSPKYLTDGAKLYTNKYYNK